MNFFGVDAHQPSKPAPAWLMAQAAAAASQATAGEETSRDLRKGEVLIVARPQGQAVLCTHGALWITCEPTSQGAEEGALQMRIQALTDACVSVLPATSRPVADAPAPRGRSR